MRSAERRPSWSHWFAPVGTLLVLGYFGFHAFSGQYGIRAHLAFEKKEAALLNDLTVLQERRSKLEARVLLLRDGSMEKDMVDERARRTLNLARTDEIVIALD